MVNKPSFMLTIIMLLFTSFARRKMYKAIFLSLMSDAFQLDLLDVRQSAEK
jgi:hypothetical protein